jgi:hypothetical protein
MSDVGFTFKTRLGGLWGGGKDISGLATKGERLGSFSSQDYEVGVWSKVVRLNIATKLGIAAKLSSGSQQLTTPSIRSVRGGLRGYDH